MLQNESDNKNVYMSCIAITKEPRGCCNRGYKE